MVEYTSWRLNMKNLYLNVLIILVYCSIWRKTDAVICYACNDLPHPADCGNIVTCGSHEICHVEHKISTDGKSTFNSNCLDTARCAAGGSAPVIGRRQNPTILCSQCCNTSYCNKNTCDNNYHPSSTGVRCLSCSDVLSPADCRTVILCSADSMCYTQAFRVNDEVRFRLGCAPKNYCSTNTSTTIAYQPVTTPSPFVPFGRRATSLKDLFGTACAMGCQTENCNMDICRKGDAAGCRLTRLPTYDRCEDVSTYGCILIVSIAVQQGESACANADVRNLFCPETCGICKNPVLTQGPVLNPNVTTKVPTNYVTTTLPTVLTTLNSSTYFPPTNMYTPNACGDYYPEFACHKVDCELQICKDQDLRSLCPNYCNGKCRSHDCKDIPGFISGSLN